MKTHLTPDQLTRIHTSFESFAELIATANTSDYFPTLTGADKQPLTDAYDAEMQRRGDSRRAWRGINHQHQNRRAASSLPVIHQPRRTGAIPKLF